jgi:hypothetical protein
MGRFLSVLSLLLVFVTATGFCQSGSFSSGQKAEIEEIVRDVIRDELQSLYRQQPVPALVTPAINIIISTNERSVAPIRNLLTEPGLSKQEDIVALIVSKNRRTPCWYIANVVETYFAEAKFERINHDIAIAQMLYATDYLNNVQRTTVNNYSGMLNVSFCDMLTGIRAHIQHLKFYAVGSLVDNRRNVDPRYSVLKANQYLGTVTTLEDLCGKWSESPMYLSNIRSMLAEMTHFAVYKR